MSKITGYGLLVSDDWGAHFVHINPSVTFADVSSFYKQTNTHEKDNFHTIFAIGIDSLNRFPGSSFFFGKTPARLQGIHGSMLPKEMRNRSRK